MALYYSSNLVRSPSVLSVKKFGDKYKVTWCKSTRKKGFQEYISDEYERLERDPFDGLYVSEVPYFESKSDTNKKKINDEKLANNISRAKSKIFEYAYCNLWDYFVTLTISPEKYNRYDLKTYIKDLGKFINNYGTHHGSKIQYLLIPELHKNGAWHMHGLIAGILPKHLVINEHGYLDFPMYSEKFGFCNLGHIKNHDAVSKYITKYITKDLLSRSFGERCYYNSKRLKKAELLYRSENISPDCIEWDFEHEDGYCKTAMIDSLDFMQNICIGADLGIETIDLKTVQQFSIDLRNRKLSRASISTYMRNTKIFLRWVYDEYGLSFDPKKQAHIYSDKEIAEIFNSIQSAIPWITLRNRAMVALMLDCGIRQCELCRLRRSDIDSVNRCMEVYGKGDKERFVPVVLIPWLCLPSIILFAHISLILFS